MKQPTQAECENGLRLARYRFIRTDARNYGDQKIKRPFAVTPQDNPMAMLLISKSTVINGDNWVFVSRWEQ